MFPIDYTSRSRGIICYRKSMNFKSMLRYEYHILILAVLCFILYCFPKYSSCIAHVLSWRHFRLLNFRYLTQKQTSRNILVLKIVFTVLVDLEENAIQEDTYFGRFHISEQPTVYWFYLIFETWIYLSTLFHNLHVIVLIIAAGQMFRWIQ